MPAARARVNSQQLEVSSLPRRSQFAVRKRNRCLDFQFPKKGKCINEEEAQRKSHNSNMSELEYLGESLLFYSLLQMSIKREVWKVLQYVIMEGRFSESARGRLLKPFIRDSCRSLWSKKFHRNLAFSKPQWQQQWPPLLGGGTRNIFL